VRVRRRVHYHGFCQSCGEWGNEFIEVQLPCPTCGVDNRVVVCTACARRFVEELVRILWGRVGWS